MSISTVITRGYGSFAGVKFIPTRGYSSSNAPPPIVIVTPVVGGGGDKRKKKKSKAKIFYAPSHIAEIVRKYNATFEIESVEEKKQIIAAVDAYIEPQNDYETMRRQTEMYLYDNIIPPSDRINFDELAYNRAAVEFIESLYSKVIEIREERQSLERQLQKQKQDKEDEDLLISLASLI